MNKICKLIYIDHLKQKHIVHHCLPYRTRNGTSHMKGRFSVPASSNERLQMGGAQWKPIKKSKHKEYLYLQCFSHLVITWAGQ